MDINAINSSSNTPLHVAAKNGYFEICKYLVEDARPIKANVLLKGLENETPKEAATQHGKTRVSEFLSIHQKKAGNWNNRNCLLKLMINKKKTETFKNLSDGLFKEIMKYT